ncbi:mitotic-spindle organizing protein 2A [Trichonephila clavipes]|uniref:Mitotic-spindle organizing protein 2A n=1 Tax=Trichonephila clavipes TaxID=2585209 RepID=A0A8X6SCD2_TRICX|nr:mitotic-spindle organizing protein 2A [Trichonephila clavipes]
MAALVTEYTLEFFTLLNARGKKELIEWCMKEGLIASSYECPKCNEQMRLNERKSVVLDRFEWRCRKKGVNTHVCRSIKEFMVNLCVIKEWVLPGSTIVSDCWKAYKCLSDEGFKHLEVNHSVCFKDPDTGAHTNSIEGTWSAIKRFLCNHTSHAEGMFDHYLAEYLWRRSRDHSLSDETFQNFLKAVVTLYPPLGKDQQ